MMPLRAFAVHSALFICFLPALAHASDFTDYRIPPSSWRRYTVSMQGSASRSTNGEAGSSARQGNVQGSLWGNYSLGADSDLLLWTAGADLAGYGQRRDRTQDQYSQYPVAGVPLSSFATRDRTRDRATDESWGVNAGFRRYPFARAIGLAMGGALRGEDEQSWVSHEERVESSSGGVHQVYETRNGSVRWNYRETATLDVGAGYGRVRDVSAVFQAVLLEERLARDHVLVRALSPVARRKLAELFSLQRDFATVHNLPDKFFWREVEQLLREDGALGEGGLAAYDVHHAADPLVVAGYFFRRQTGWFAGPVVSARHEQQISRSDLNYGARDFFNGVLQQDYSFNTGTRTKGVVDDIRLGGRLEWYRPIGSRTQLGFSEEALVSHRKEGEGLSVRGQASVQRLLAERWFAQAYAGHNREIQSVPYHRGYWQVSAGAALEYFLEDYCRLYLRAQQSNAAYESGKSLPRLFRSRDLRVSFGVTVGRGRLDAPGLIQPVRPAN